MRKLKIIFNIIVIATGVLVFTNSFAMTSNGLEIDVVNNVKVLGVSADTVGRIPRVTIKKMDYSKVIENKYTPLSQEAYFVSSGFDERMLLRMSARVQSKPAAIVGYNQGKGYIEYLPYNYDASQKTVEFTAENNMAIIPVAYNTKYKKSLPENTISTLAISTTDKNFNITSNYGGYVSINIQTLYNSSNTFYYKIYKDSTLVKDKTYITSSSFSTSFGSRGVYRFEIYKQNSFWLDTKLWEQEVYVEPNPLNTSVKNTLNGMAEQYAPIMTLSQNERYKPIQLTDILSNSSYMIALNTKNGTSRISLPGIKNYIRYNGYSKALFEGHWGLGTVSDSLEDMPISSYAPHVYYSYSATDTNYIINYHFFYNFDPKTPSSSWNAHNFDREQISVTFNKNTLQPENIYYPQHLLNSNMGLRSDNGNEVSNIIKDDSATLATTWTGYVKMAFSIARINNMVYDNTHPVIAVAEGSHAPYPLSATYKVNDSNEPAGISTSINESHFLIPCGVYNNRAEGSSFTTNNCYNMSALQIDNITSGSASLTSLNLLAFSGDWVDLVGIDNEKFPPFIDIMRNAEGFINESIKSNKHTFTMTNIPSSIVERTNNIKAYLEDNLN